MRTGRVAVLVLAVLIFVAACGGAASPAAAPGTPVAATGGQVTVTAQNIALWPAQITTLPGPLTIDYQNRDAGVPHDLVLFAGNDIKLASTEIITGPATTTLAVPALVPGPYRLTCTVHPNMTASLEVSAGP